MVDEPAKKAKEWVKAFSSPAEGLKKVLTSIYGENPQLIEEKRITLVETAKLFDHVYSPEGKTIIVRVPGRVNLMGTHTDGQRSYKNYMALDKEILLIAQERKDNKVIVHNKNPRFRPGAFCIGEELPSEKRRDWLKYINEVEIFPGDWLNYVKAGVLVLQNRYLETEIRGMNLLFNGNIPLSAGLSSSSALVVASALVTTELNDLDIPREELVSLCGQGEWYVGTRGGVGDQAAQLFCKRENILHIRFTPTDFMPFEMEHIPFPTGYSILVCNSLKEAKKAVEAKDASTARGVSQWIGTAMVREAYFEIDYLSDLISAPFSLEEPEIYRILKSLPETINRKQLFGRFPDRFSQLEALFRTHKEPITGYKVRQVCTYILAEAERGKIFAQLLRGGGLKKAGELMYTAHDGDRIVSSDENGQKRKWCNRVSNKYLEGLIADWRSGDPCRRESAKLYRQPGGFGCSCEELDLIVDISRRVEGVLGARLTGAGLGGCMVMLIEKKKVEAAMKTLEEAYYRPRGLPPAMYVCAPVEGGGLLKILD